MPVQARRFRGGSGGRLNRLNWFRAGSGGSGPVQGCSGKRFMRCSGRCFGGVSGPVRGGSGACSNRP